MRDLEDVITLMLGVGLQLPQAAYVVLQKSLKLEWNFLWCANQGLVEDFELTEKYLQEAFIPSLFHRSEATITVWNVNSLPVKNVILDLPGPTQNSQVNWTASFMVTGHLIAFLWDSIEFRFGNHYQLLWRSRANIRRCEYHDSGEELTLATGGIFLTEACRLRQGQKTGLAFIHAFHRQWDGARISGM